MHDAADRLSGGDYHSVVVVDATGHLAGIVTSTDLIRYAFKKEYPENLEKFVSENM